MDLNSLKAGHWAFLVGLVLAVIAPFFNIPYFSTILFILGLVIGFVNIKERESDSFLIAVIALITIGVGGIQLLALTAPVAAILANLIVLLSPAALVVGVKQVFTIGRSV